MAVQCLGYVIHPDEIAQCVSLLGKAAFCTRLCCARPSTRNRSMIWQSIDFLILYANFVATRQISTYLTKMSIRDMGCFQYTADQNLGPGRGSIICLPRGTSGVHIACMPERFCWYCVQVLILLVLCIRVFWPVCALRCSSAHQTHPKCCTHVYTSPGALFAASRQLYHAPSVIVRLLC